MGLPFSSGLDSTGIGTDTDFADSGLFVTFDDSGNAIGAAGLDNTGGADVSGLSLNYGPSSSLAPAVPSVGSGGSANDASVFTNPPANANPSNPALYGANSSSPTAKPAGGLNATANVPVNTTSAGQPNNSLGAELSNALNDAFKAYVVSQGGTTTAAGRGGVVTSTGAGAAVLAGQGGALASVAQPTALGSLTSGSGLLILLAVVAIIVILFVVEK